MKNKRREDSSLLLGLFTEEQKQQTQHEWQTIEHETPG